MNKVFLPIIFFLIGTIFASFSNMLMYRFANDKPIIKDKRSYCPKCGHQINWYDNIPIISYLVLKGKCRHCHQPISKRYFLVEVYGGFSFVIIYFFYMCFIPTKSFELSSNYLDLIKTIAICFILLFLLVSSYVDHKKREIPISMMITMLAFALLNFIIDWIVTKQFKITYVLGFAIPIILFLAIYLLGTLIFKKEPMGLGDIILFAILGLMFGALNLLSIVLFSSLICSIVELIRIKKTNTKREIPFVPYIYVGTLITVLFTPYIVEGINKLIGGI